MQPANDGKGSEKTILLIGCGCVFLLFVLTASGIGLWFYLQKHPSILKPASKEEPSSKEPVSDSDIEPPTPDLEWSPGNEENTNYIPALKARTDVLRFFEASLDRSDEDKKHYKYSFDTNQTRAVYWELDLENTAPGRTIPFEIEEHWFHENDPLVTQSFQTTMEPDWDTSNYYHGWGYANPGRWKLGQYRLDLYVNGLKILSGFFTISDAHCRGSLEMVSQEQLGQYERAAGEYEGQEGAAANLARKKLAIAYHNRAGNCYLNGNADAAVGYYIKALDIIPQYPLALMNRARAYIDLGKNDEAIADLNETIRMKPDDAYYYDIRGMTLLVQGKKREALKDLNHAVELDPKDANYVQHRGIAHWRLWDRQAALEDFQTALNLLKQDDADNRKKMAFYIEMVRHSYPILPERSLEFDSTTMPD